MSLNYVKSNNLKKENYNVTAIIIVILIFFSKIINALTGLSLLSSLDEIILAIFLLPFIFLKNTNKLELTLMFVLVYFILISTFQQSSTLIKILIQSLVHLKLFIFLIILNKYFNLKMIQITIKYLFLITLIGLVLNLIMQNSFNLIFKLDSTIRSGLLRLNGLQLSSNNLGITIVFIFIYYIFTKNRTTFVIVLAFVFSVLLLILIGSRTAIIGLIIPMLLYLKTKSFNLKIILYTLSIPLTSIIIYLFSNSELVLRTINNFEMVQNTNSDGYIRGIMINNSFKLFILNFPFGSGAATYGSVLSKDSQIYESLGLNSMRFFEEMSGIFDSNWASIIGEFGFIGLFIFVMLLRKAYLFVCLDPNVNKQAVQSLFYILIVSAITMPIFMNGYLAMLFALFITYFKKNKLQLDESTYYK